MTYGHHAGPAHTRTHTQFRPAPPSSIYSSICPFVWAVLTVALSLCARPRSDKLFSFIILTCCALVIYTHIHTHTLAQHHTHWEREHWGDKRNLKIVFVWPKHSSEISLKQKFNETLQFVVDVVVVVTLLYQWKQRCGLHRIAGHVPRIMSTFWHFAIVFKRILWSVRDIYDVSRIHMKGSIKCK